MATVYLAHDLRHDREVAVKVLRPELAAVIGAERFLSEIKTTAHLQHPHILPLFDSGAADGFLFYVMPLVEGETLRDRINHEKQLPVNEAVRIAVEVAGALDYAHRHNVIHRDIKPENILLHDGSALVADFGIALAASKAGGSRMTETGMSLGTPTYMSPEQAMGEREITARSDVYALGCITYEMLSGDPPFTGSTAQAIVARVVTESPRPLIPQRHTIPPEVEAAVLTALEKLPADRFASAAAFAAALEGRSGAPTVSRTAASASARTRRNAGRLLAMTGLVAFGLGALLTGLWLESRQKPVPGLQASLLPPPDCRYGELALGPPQLSPDGTRLAFLADCPGEGALWLRQLATGRVQRLEGTTGGQFPFWSPDGASLGFFSGAELKRIDLGTGAVRNLASVVAGRGGSWSPQGTIVYAPDIFSPLMRVPATGGTPQPATVLSKSEEKLTHRNPLFLPDGEHFLFNEGLAASNGTGVTRLGRLGTTESRQVMDLASNLAYALGRLLYMKEGVLVSQRFDPGSGKLSGAPASLVPKVEVYQARLLGNYTIAGGTMVYREPVAAPSRIVWFDPAARREEVILPGGNYGPAVISPDRRRLLLSRSADGERTSDLWLFDLAGSTWSRVTAEKGEELVYGWFPDGKHFFYYDVSSNHPLRIVSWSDGTVVDTIARLTFVSPIATIAPDGSYGIGGRQVEGTGHDIMRLDLHGEHRVATPLVATPANEQSPQISPDGRLLAYVSDRSGRPELMATPLPGAKVEWQLSQEGANGVMAWAPSGRALYYLDYSGRLMVIDVSNRDQAEFGKPRLVAGAPPSIQGIQAASDGRLVVNVVDAGSDAPLTLVTGWQETNESQ